jgi:hypothetical protein
VPTDFRPQYLLSSPHFRFPAIARLSGTLAHGQGRESMVALLLVVRLVASVLSDQSMTAVSVARADAARAWLRASCPDRRVRAAALGVCDAIIAGEERALRVALQGLASELAEHLTPAARAELGPYTVPAPLARTPAAG